MDLSGINHQPSGIVKAKEPVMKPYKEWNIDDAGT
jgi:hypothetical protein